MFNLGPNLVLFKIIKLSQLISTNLILQNDIRVVMTTKLQYFIYISYIFFFLDRASMYTFSCKIITAVDNIKMYIVCCTYTMYVIHYGQIFF